MTDLKLKPKQKNHNMFLKSLPEGYLHFENIKSAFEFKPGIYGPGRNRRYTGWFGPWKS